MRPIVLLSIVLLSLFAAGCSSNPSNSPVTTETVLAHPPAASTPQSPRPPVSTVETPTGALAPAPTAISPSPLTPMPKGGSPALPTGVGGKIVFAPGDGSIWMQDPLTAAPKALVKGSAEVFSESPAFSPDGNTIAFRQLILNPNTAASPVIQIMDVTNHTLRTVARTPDVKSDLYWPAWSPDGQSIYYTLEAADHTHSEIRRVRSSGGESQKVMDGGRQAVISPDGKTIAFIRFNVQSFSGALWIANADGSNARQLVRDDTFLTIAAPHFSPDGKWILFAASGPPKHELRAQTMQDPSCQPSLLCAFSEPAFADGLPWDLWVVSPNGGQSQQLTRIGSDSPWPAWSRDGKYVAFFETDGTYLLDVASGVITQISRNGGHGIMDWWEP